jgi:prepilin-type N-terminal cleavage/methylation domain-containing protein
MRRITLGFTLIETLVVTALMGLLLVVLYDFFLITNTFFYTANGEVSAATNARMAVTEITTLTRTSSHALASRTFSGVSYTAGPTTLILELPAVGVSGAVIVGVYDYVVFYLTNGVLYEKVEANGSSSRLSRTRILADTVSALTFTYDNADYSLIKAVTVDLTTQAVVKGQTFSTHLREQVYRRN